MELPLPELVMVIAVCTTNGCENQNIGIEIETPKQNITVMCGPCGNQTQVIVKNEADNGSK